MLGRVPDARAVLGRGARIVAEHLGRAAVRVEEAEEQLQGRALARAVRPQQPRDALVDLVADRVERPYGTERLREARVP